MEDLYFNKYLEYKEKYLKLKELLGGAECGNIKLSYIDIKGTGITGESRIFHPNLDQTANYALQFTYSAIDPISNKMNTYDGIFSIEVDVFKINIKNSSETMSISFNNTAEFQAHRKSNTFLTTNPITINVPVHPTLIGRQFIFKKTDKSFEYKKCRELPSPNPNMDDYKTRSAYYERNEKIKGKKGRNN
jgi:hypothetical protein